MIKDTLIFILITALILVMKIGPYKNRRQSLKEILADAVKPIILLEFIANLEPLSLICELILLPALLVFYFGFYTNKDKPGQEKTTMGFSIMITLTSLYLIYHGAHYIFANFDTIDKRQTIRDFLFPVLMTTAFLPYLYATIKYMNWEENRIRRKIKGNY